MRFFVKKAFLLVLVAVFPFLSALNVHEAHLPAGWYTNDKVMLQKELNAYFALSRQVFPVVAESNLVKALIVPHAGHYYSGLCMASTYQTLIEGVIGKKNIKNKTIKRIIILAPSHTQYFSGVALPDYPKYKTVLGTIPIDNVACSELQKDALFTVMSKPHSKEHAIEVQLPFLQEAVESFELVPLIIGHIKTNEYDAIATMLAKIVDNTTLLVISSDFVHYGKQYSYVPAKTNILSMIKRIDSRAIEAISKKSFSAFDEVMKKTGATICGERPIKLLLKLIENGVLKEVNPRFCCYYTSVQLLNARLQGNRYFEVEKLLHTLSDSQVDSCVSYAGLMFSQDKQQVLAHKDRMTGYEKKALLQLARDIIKNELLENKIEEHLLYPILSPGMLNKAGVFVTLNTKAGKLRGCIGSIAALQRPLIQMVADMAKAAAFHDTRFQPLKKEELSNINIDITVLTPSRKIKGYEEIVLGKHGVFLTKILPDGRRKSAVFLPQVPVSFGWDLYATLEQLCIKAGLKANDWRSGCEFEVFEGFEIKE